MNPQSVRHRSLRVAALLLVALLAFSCGGGGSVVFVPLPGVVIVITANPAQVPESGENVTFTIVVLNDGNDDLTIDDLFNDVYDLDTECPGAVGTVLAPTQTFQCVFTAFVGGNVADSPIENTTTAQVTSAGGTETFEETGSVILTQELMPIFTPDQSNPVLPSISMQAGAVSDTAFDVQIEVTNIDDFFGAAFQVTFLSGSVDYVDFSSAGSILFNGAANPTFEITELAPGQLAVLASLPEGTPAGLSDEGLLLTLEFNATALVSANPFRFPVPSRLVEVCPLNQACQEVQGVVTWEEGELDVE